MFSWTVVRYVLTAAVRDRLILSFLLIAIVGASMSVFLGSAAITESDQFAVVFAGGVLRLFGMVGLVLFVVFYIRRAFDSKDVEILLSRPVSRVSFLLSHSAAFSILAFIVAVVVFLTVCAIAPNSLGAGHGLWAFSLLVEYIIIVNVALFFAMVLPNAAIGSMVVFALYLLSRIIGQVLGIIDAGIAVSGFDVLANAMHIISLIVPRLDLMAQTSWLIYGPDQIGYGFILFQGIAYTALVILAALVDLVKRQF